jgi:hypothetical protein
LKNLVVITCMYLKKKNQAFIKYDYLKNQMLTRQLLQQMEFHHYLGNSTACPMMYLK